MDREELNKFLSSKQSRIDLTIENVIARGYDDEDEDFDDYALLIDKKEYQELIALEIYENYFLPQRHEFELRILKDIIDAIVECRPLAYTLIAASSGIIGNLATYVVKKLFIHVTSKFKDQKRKRYKTFNAIKRDITNLT